VACKRGNACGLLVVTERAISLSVYGGDSSALLLRTIDGLILDGLERLVKGASRAGDKKVFCICPCGICANAPAPGRWLATAVLTAPKSTLRCPVSEAEVSVNDIAPDLCLAAFGKDFLATPTELSALGQQLGKGSYGTVHLAQWKGREVAVKVFKANSSGLDTLLAFGAFWTEGWLWKDMSHPSLVKLFKILYQPTCSFVMEPLPGGSVAAYIQSSPKDLSWDLRARMATDIAKGLQYLHSRKPPIMHRDLKSHNVLLKDKAPPKSSDDAWAKIIDFGTATEGFCTTGRVVDNPTWMAPEVLLDKDYDQRPISTALASSCGSSPR
jgi:hypothetical protein